MSRYLCYVDIVSGMQLETEQEKVRKVGEKGMANVLDEQMVTEVLETNVALDELVMRLNAVQSSLSGVQKSFADTVDSMEAFTHYQSAFQDLVALKELQKNMLMVYNSLQTLTKGFANFRFGIQNGNLTTGLVEGFNVLKNSMTGIQKGLVGVTAGFLEFFAVKDSMHDILTGTESIIANIGKMAVAITGAGVAFNAVLGFPAGLIVTGITWVIGALAEVGEAFEEIEAEEFGESVKSALSNPGGIPIGELTNNVVSSIASIGEQFSVITEKSQELDLAEKNIQDIWLEIETILRPLQKQKKE